MTKDLSALSLANNNKQYKTKINWKKTSLWLPFLLLGIVMILLPLAMILIIAFIPVDGGSVNDNWSILNATIWMKIFKSLGIAILSTIICLLIAFPFCYFTTQIKSKNTRKWVFLLISMPMWLGSLIILISLKMLFDKVNGEINSTYGDIYSIIGIIYLYLPYMIIPLYNALEELPRNIVLASRDLGRGSFYTFFRVIVPYTKEALLSAITLVLLPAMTVVAVPQFLNNDPNGSLIGDIVNSQAMQATESKIALARVCVMTLMISLVMFIVYLLISKTPAVWRKIMIYRTKKGMKNAK